MEHEKSDALCIYSADLVGLDLPLIEVEVHVSRGLPRLDIVGLAETCVRESKQRIRSAIMTSGWTFPDHKITINLAPPSIKKTATGLDLAMAIGILRGAGLIETPPGDFWRQHLLVGELGLTGKLRPTAGILNVATMAKKRGFKKIFLPVENTPEASLIPNLELFPANDLREVVAHISGEKMIPSLKTSALQTMTRSTREAANPTKDAAVDLGDVKGQMFAKKALLAAAAGGHNLLFVGPPGAGKTFLARCLPGILPPLNEEEAIETTRIFSCKGLAEGHQALMQTPPFRSPHHSISDAGLVGGGKSLLPGEVSLAHNGVLFLDELPEFQRNVLELLREPLESGVVHLSRAQGVIAYPARIQLIAAMNPCPCGYADGVDNICRCSARTIRHYRQKVSGPLLDRVDLRLYVHPVSYDHFFQAAPKNDFDSTQARLGVLRARARQAERFRNESFKRNAHIPTARMRLYCGLNARREQILKESIMAKKISARGIHRVLRVARTLADLHEEPEINEEALLSALNFCEIPTHWE